MSERWATFEDEDGAWRIVTEDGDDVTWPEMGRADVERVVVEHNALVLRLTADHRGCTTCPVDYPHQPTPRHRLDRREPA